MKTWTLVSTFKGNPWTAPGFCLCLSEARAWLVIGECPPAFH